MKKYILYLILAAFLAGSGCKKDDDAKGGPNSQALGSSAHELLSPEKQGLTIEILYVEGYQPQQSSLDNLGTFLETMLNKPGGISFVKKEIPSPGKSVLSLDDIIALERKYRTAYTGGSTIAVSLLVVDAGYTDDNSDSKVLGLAYMNTSIVLFGKNIQENSGGLSKPSRMKLETTTMEHEFGHLLGLVNLGSAMQTNHEDAAHSKHCDNQSCLMYFEANTTGMMEFLMNNNVPELDGNCRNDLKANGGK